MRNKPIETRLNEKIDEFVKNHEHVSKALHKKLDVHASAIVIMELLGEDHLSLKQLTEKSHLDKSTLSRQVNQLVTREWVVRKVGQDKRYVRFFVTGTGKEKLDLYHKEKNAFLSSILLNWTEEEKQLLFVLIGRLGRSFSQGSTL